MAPLRSKLLTQPDLAPFGKFQHCFKSVSTPRIKRKSVLGFKSDQAVKSATREGGNPMYFS